MNAGVWVAIGMLYLFWLVLYWLAAGIFWAVSTLGELIQDRRNRE